MKDASAYRGSKAWSRTNAAMASSLDLASLNDMPERKRLTLVAALILKQVARSLDDAAEMFIRQVQKMHNKASDALVLYRAAHAERTDALVARLREIALAYKAEGTREQRLAAIEMLLAPFFCWGGLLSFCRFGYLLKLPSCSPAPPHLIAAAMARSFHSSSSPFL